MASRYNVPYLGAIPLNVRIRENGDEGRPIVHADPENPVSASFREVASKVATRISKINIGEGTAEKPDSTAFIPLKMG